MKKSAHGFTLIELLVIITILAALSTIGYAVYSGAQAKARDAKRIADIDNIAKSLESSKNYITGRYYNKLSTDFPSSDGIPADPKGVTSYCICANGGQTTERPDPPSGWNSGCPLPFEWGGNNIFPCFMTTPINNTIDSNLSFQTSDGGVKSWKVCAKKESDNSSYCKHSLGN